MSAGEIQIPDRFFNRLRTDVDRLDAVFGDGILPGSTITINANPGVGKSTLMLQLSQLLTNKDRRAAYVSGEECVYMVAMAAKRLLTTDVKVACENKLSVLLNWAEDLDLLIIDSFPTIRYDLDDADEYSNTELSERKLMLLIEKAQSVGCAIVFILHNTKMGVYKGGAEIQHAVDVNIEILKDKENPGIRIINVYKNRVGSTDAHTFLFTSTGYDFVTEAVVSSEDSITGGSGGKRSQQKAVKSEQMEQIMAMDEITTPLVMDLLGIDVQTANYLLWQLCTAGKLVRSGRGVNKIYTKQ